MSLGWVRDLMSNTGEMEVELRMGMLIFRVMVYSRPTVDLHRGVIPRRSNPARGGFGLCVEARLGEEGVMGFQDESGLGPGSDVKHRGDGSGIESPLLLPLQAGLNHPAVVVETAPFAHLSCHGI
jgi:hypothetical protein